MREDTARSRLLRAARTYTSGAYCTDSAAFHCRAHSMGVSTKTCAAGL